MGNFSCGTGQSSIEFVYAVRLIDLRFTWIGSRRYLNSVSQCWLRWVVRYSRSCWNIFTNMVCGGSLALWIYKINTYEFSLFTSQTGDASLENNLFGIQRSDGDGNLCVKFEYFFHQMNSFYICGDISWRALR